VIFREEIFGFVLHSFCESNRLKPEVLENVSKLESSEWNAFSGMDLGFVRVSASVELFE
jgi:hypothetical protein